MICMYLCIYVCMYVSDKTSDVHPGEGGGGVFRFEFPAEWTIFTDVS